jgi:hypothetical protein
VLYYLGAADTSGIEARRNLDELNAILDRNDSGDSIRVFVGADGGARLATSEYRLEVSAADAVANDSDAVELAERLRDRIDALTELERRRVALLYYLIGSERETH